MNLIENERITIDISIIAKAFYSNTGLEIPVYDTKFHFPKGTHGIKIAAFCSGCAAWMRESAHFYADKKAHTRFSIRWDGWDSGNLSVKEITAVSAMNILDLGIFFGIPQDDLRNDFIREHAHLL